MGGVGVCCLVRFSRGRSEQQSAEMSWSARMIALKGYFSTIVVMSAVFTACFGESELCETDTSSLCVATCSGQKVNISGILVYPIAYVRHLKC